VSNVYEIHRYQSDQFQYVVARTNKHSETKVREDVERMNSMLSEEFKSQGIKYIFSVGNMAEFMKSVSKRQKERSRSEKGIFYR
jgi:tRNA U34 2-thiouridine synthase MnmA/TrmU